MEDNAIVALYWARDESAIAATDERYGPYCGGLARRMLGDAQEAEECVNDTWLRAWQSMPPQRPRNLRVYLGCITRRLALDRFRQRKAGRRGGGELPLVLDELAECVSGAESVESETAHRELSSVLNGFLASLPPRSRRIFVKRYWFGESVSGIAKDNGMTAGAVSALLGRLRQKLKAYLTERGIEV